MRTTHYIALGLSLFSFACSDTGLGDGQGAPPPAMFPAAHPTPPQVVSLGGAVMSAPKFIPIVYAADDPQYLQWIPDFTSKIGPSQYWATVTKEYGVGPGTSTKAVVVQDTLANTITDDDIQNWLTSKLNADDPSLPKADDNNLYSFFFPANVTITVPLGFGNSMVSCQDFGGYHAEVVLDAAHGNASIAYAVLPRCNALDDLTTAASHEFMEAATDPFPDVNPAFGDVDIGHFYWSQATQGGEIGDMCQMDHNAYIKPDEIGYVVQRGWSNASVLAGHDPCVPELTHEVYFNTAPELPDMLATRGGQIPAVKVAPGSSRTITLDLFSEADTGGDWSVAVADAAKAFGTSTTGFQFSLDKTTGHNGDKINLTITSAKTSSRSRGTFYIVSRRNNSAHTWFGFIGQ